MLRYFSKILLSVVGLSTLAAAQLAESYIVVERYSKRVLLADNSEKKRPVAGLSHMVTAKVAMDWAKAAGASSSTLLVVPQHAYQTVAHNPLGLQAGDQISLRDAVYASLLTSDCVASTTLAHYVGQQLAQRRNVAAYPVAIFVEEMNALARAFGMTRTHFVLPCGADSLRRNSYSTASDIARLGVKLAEDSGFAFYVKQKSRTVKVVKADGAENAYEISNANGLLKDNPKVAGFKASFSPQAGQCLAGLVNRDFFVEETANGGKKVTPVQMVVVALGSTNSSALTEQLIPQGWSQYENWRNQGYLSAPKRRGFLKMPQTQ